MDLVRVVNDIVWYIPFKKLRNAIREFLISLYLKDYESLKALDIYRIIEFRFDIERDDKFHEKYLKLIENLDFESEETINSIILDKIMLYKDTYDPVWIVGDEAKNINYTKEKFIRRIKKTGNNQFMYTKYLLPINCFEMCVFNDRHSINSLNNIEKIKEKNIIDAGAFIGDSALILSEYTNKNVYSFEPILANYKLMLETIKINKRKNIIPINMALGEKEDSFKIFNNVEYGLITNINNRFKNDTNYIEENIVMITLDKYVKDNNIEVGLIKTDLEGYEQNFLHGAIETIKNQKPTLIISIYHNYSDFFNIKPFIEKLNLGYKFRIIKPSNPGYIVTETILICEI